jgi:hypothetical protein
VYHSEVSYKIYIYIKKTAASDNIGSFKHTLIYRAFTNAVTKIDTTGIGAVLLHLPASLSA